MTAKNLFIDDVGLTESTSLTHLLDKLDRDDNIYEEHLIKHSPYYSENKFTNLLSTKSGLCIINLNIQNIFTKFDEFSIFVDRINQNTNNSIHVICLNECWIDEWSNLFDIQLDNYTMYSQRGNRKGHSHCGLVTYIHKQFTSKEIQIEKTNTAWDSMSIEITRQHPNSKKYLISNIYRLPLTLVEDYTTFTEEFVTYLNNISYLNRPTFICGDFNIDLLSIKSNQHYSNYFDQIITKGFFPRITLPTRIQPPSFSLIDNILSNDIQNNDDSLSGILINDISDHKLIFTFLPNNRHIENVPKHVEIETTDELSIENFIKELKIMDLYNKLKIVNTTQANHDIFSRLIEYARDKHLPKKIVRFDRRKHKKSKWITNGILQSINTKNKLYKIFIQSDPSNEALYEVLRNEYKTYRTTLRKSIREAKRKYYARTFETFKSDIKRTWSIINNSLKTNSKQQQSKFIINDVTTTDPDEIANGFNNYFINIGVTIADQIQSTRHFSEYLTSPATSHFNFNLVNEDEISKIIDKLKNKSSYGHDCISNKLIKRMKTTILKSITFLINQMLSSGHFPDQLKISRVKPLFKNGDSSLLSNYRPISLLSSFSKIYEYVMFNQLYDYMNEKKMFCVHQFGFRPGHSTELAALKLVNELTKTMDIGVVPLNIYIDLSKAFDTLEHTILLSKLNYYGVSGIENNLFRSYLTNRLQYVEYNGAKSARKRIITGVPQGSILGPLLFLIYINDLPETSTMFDMLMYADDTTLYCNLTAYNTQNCINAELKAIQYWMASNKLSLNTAKTKFMVFHTPQKNITIPSLMINNTTIEHVKQFNFLGLIINTSLKWNSHIDYIILKISRIVGLLYRLKHIYPKNVLYTLYNSLILPHLTYCILIWGSTIVKGHPLHLLQKRAVRTISNSDYLAHSEPICKRMKLLIITDIYRIAIWKFYYKLMNGNLPSYFTSMKPTLPAICARYEIRKPVFHLPRLNHHFAEHLVEYQMTKFLNEPGSIEYILKVQTHSFVGYKLFVKNKIIDSYTNQCLEVNCISCART